MICVQLLLAKDLQRCCGGAGEPLKPSQTVCLCLFGFLCKVLCLGVISAVSLCLRSSFEEQCADVECDVSGHQRKLSELLCE
ncbi:hypothetical protein STEG23_022444, partial [Scotinomys teguina]